MSDELSRVTVVGAQRRVDIAVPSRAPVAEYVGRLADLCGQDRDNVLPAAWSLAPAGGGTMPLHASLADVPIIDGQVLYLRDLTDSSHEDLVVDELDEVVADEAARQRWTVLPRGVVLAGLGLAWIAATALYLSLQSGVGVVAPAVTLAGAGVALLGGAWSMAQQRSQVPPALIVFTSLSAIPCLAGAGALVAAALFGVEFAWAGAVVGANVAAIMAIAATPEPVLFAAELQLAAAAVLTPIILGAALDGIGLAAVATVTAVLLLATAKWSAAGIAAWATRPPRHDAGLAGDVTNLLLRTGRLLGVVVAGPALALVFAVSELAFAHDWAAFVLACVVTIGLLGRTAQAGVGAEMIVLGTAGMASLFILVTAISQWLSMGTWGVVGVATVGLLVVTLGVALVFRHRTVGVSGADAELGGATPPVRRTVAEVLVTLCDFATLPLALTVFGVFAMLAALGRTWVS